MSQATMKCPFCNGENKVDDDVTQVTCVFCGAKFAAGETSCKSSDMIQSLLRQAEEAGSDQEAYDFACKACEADKESCDAWIAKARYSFDTDTREKAISAARGLATNSDQKAAINELIDTPAVEIEWESAVCEWQCVFTINGERVHLDKSQRKTRFLPVGVYEFILTAPQKKKTVTKKTIVRGNCRLHLGAAKGLMSSNLLIEFR